ncbi:MAG TPA: hypothetical protein DHV36_02025 [Desulfobacteraceae bacterium]|nr:hypothetical protein [Desulfobacteraceae bacterium]
MNITCPHCKTKLNLPDHKIPKDRDSSFKCPKCKESVPVKASKPKKESPSFKTPGTGTGFRRGGRQHALICIPSATLRQRVTAAVSQAGFTPEVPETPADALDCLEYKVFPLVVMDEDFDTDGVMAVHMNEMDMSLRRKFCLVRICGDVATGDPMTALHASANYIVNRSELAQEGELATDILALAMEEHKNFYTVFNESLKATGKA